MPESATTHRLRDLPTLWRDLAAAEWRSRTAFGKLWSPVWLAGAALLWCFSLVLVALVAVVGVAAQPPTLSSDD